MKQFVAITEYNEVIGNQTFLTKIEAKIFAEYHGFENFNVLEYIN